MRLLLDTHTVIWFLTNDANLSNSLRSAIKNSNNESYISIASIWEIGIKQSLNKLELSKNLSDLIIDIESSSFNILPITTRSILQLTSLHFHHRDPFDRIFFNCASNG
jgi:PIN domain nuclease of toxin-antitoxin system